jgi:hypothetical protein
MKRVLDANEGGLALLTVIVALGLFCEHANLSCAHEVVISALAVLLVKLNDSRVSTYPRRVTALVVCLCMGLIGVVVRIHCGEQVLLATLAVLLVLINEGDGRQQRSAKLNVKLIRSVR